jgi:hypothetical protein
VKADFIPGGGVAVGHVGEEDHLVITRVFRALTRQEESQETGDLESRVYGHKARLARHGMLIFLGQILSIAAVPLFDRGQVTAPPDYVFFSLALAIAIVWILGYQRLTVLLVATSAIAGGWFLFGFAVTTGVHPPPILMFLVVKVICVAICIRQAFRSNVPATQRIYCGAASFIMLGVVFAGIHAFVSLHELGTYGLPSEFEGGREIRWVDYIWFSFATLTTAGYSDLVPVGSVPLTIASLEGLCGLLFPATLIARIASLSEDRGG